MSGYLLCERNYLLDKINEYVRNNSYGVFFVKEYDTPGLIKLTNNTLHILTQARYVQQVYVYGTVRFTLNSRHYSIVTKELDNIRHLEEYIDTFQV